MPFRYSKGSRLSPGQIERRREAAFKELSTTKRADLDYFSERIKSTKSAQGFRDIMTDLVKLENLSDPFHKYVTEKDAWRNAKNLLKKQQEFNEKKISGKGKDESVRVIIEASGRNSFRPDESPLDAVISLFFKKGFKYAVKVGVNAGCFTYKDIEEVQNEL